MVLLISVLRMKIIDVGVLEMGKLILLPILLLLVPAGLKYGYEYMGLGYSAVLDLFIEAVLIGAGMIAVVYLCQRERFMDIKKMLLGK